MVCRCLGGVDRRPLDLDLSGWRRRRPCRGRRRRHEDINLIGTVDDVVDRANAFREAGVTHLLGTYFAANDESELRDQMQVFAEEVVPRIG